MLDRILGLLASYGIVECSLDDVDGSHRLYGLNDVSKYFVPNQDGVSLGPVLALIQDEAFLDSWFNEVFSTAMFNHTTLVLQKILEAYKGFEHIKQLVDVGGSLGNTLKVLPSVKHVGGDMFQSVPNGDAILIKWILHDWSDEHCLKLLKNCYKSIPEGGKVIVVESVLPELPETSTHSKINSLADVLVMTQYPGGKERTKHEFTTLATEAGFSGIRFVCFFYNLWVMEFYK
ncbi:hypothetical protein WN943_015351 [Citrus x changshan-huyou]